MIELSKMNEITLTGVGRVCGISGKVWKSQRRRVGELWRRDQENRNSPCGVQVNEGQGSEA